MSRYGIFALALSIAGIIVLGMWVRGDRRNSRLRCPKCWYDMSYSNSLVCSECGYHARNQSELMKSRRRAIVAVIGVGLLLAGYSFVHHRDWRRSGWIGMVPTTALLALIEVRPSAAGREELASRAQMSELLGWQEAWFAAIIREDLTQNNDIAQVRRAANELSWLDSCAQRSISELLVAIGHSDVHVRVNAAGALGHADRDHARVADAIIKLYTSDADDRVQQRAGIALVRVVANAIDNGVDLNSIVCDLELDFQRAVDVDRRLWTARLLSLIQPRHDGAVQQLIEGVQQGNSGTRTICAVALADIARRSNNATVEESLHTLLLDADDEVRFVTCDAMARNALELRMTEEELVPIVAVLEEATRDGTPKAREWAVGQLKLLMNRRTTSSRPR